MYGVTDKLMWQVQSVQNAAARLITGAKRREHITPNCVNFIGCRSDDVLNLRLPAWYIKCCQAKYLPIWLTIFVSPSGPLREKVLSLVFTVVLVTCFAAAEPRIWNNLPASLRDKEVSCTAFRRELKTFVFQTDCGSS